MGIALARRWAPIAVAAVALALAAGGCGSAVSGTRTAPASPALRVSLPVAASGRSVRVVGGSAAMRTHARQILAGMGRTAIAIVRFGRAPADFGQFRGVPGPDWIAVTVAVRHDPFHGSMWSQLSADGALWQADVFENAYLARPPSGSPRIRGTSEAYAFAGRSQQFTSGLASRTAYTGSPLSDAAARAALVAAAARARFPVGVVTFIHPQRAAATLILRARGHPRFRQRYGVLVEGLHRVQGRLGGLEWEIVDRCGAPVAVSSGGTWVNPRWLCPNPFIIGFPPSPAACRRLARRMPVC